MSCSDAAVGVEPAVNRDDHSGDKAAGIVRGEPEERADEVAHLSEALLRGCGKNLARACRGIAVRVKQQSAGTVRYGMPETTASAPG